MTNFGLNERELYLQQLVADPDDFYYGDQLKALLVEKFGVSDTNARKIINRSADKGLIRSTYPVSFGRGTFAYHTPFKRLGIDELALMARERRPSLYRLISALSTCGGILSYYEALKIAGAPLEVSSTKVKLLDELIEELTVFKLVQLKTDSRKVRYILAVDIPEDQLEGMMVSHYAKMTVDSIFVYDILGSLKKLNLVDTAQLVYRNRKFPSIGATHNNFVWDAYGYTSTTGINTVYGGGDKVNAKQTLVVLDIVISRPYMDFDLDGFFSRIQVLLNSSAGPRKILPIVVFDQISSEVLNRARALGLLSYQMSSFFGQHISHIIGNVAEVKKMEYTAKMMENRAVKLVSESLGVMDRTGNTDNLQNLKGDFFQSLIYQLLHSIYPDANIEQSVRLGAMDSTVNEKPNKRYEYDFVVRHSRTKQVIFVEVKGYRPNAIIRLGDADTPNTLKWFFGRTFLTAKKHYKNPLFQDYVVRSLFITSAGFDVDGKEFLLSLDQGKQKPDELDVGYDGQKLLKLVEQQRLTLLKKTLQQYFLR